MCQHGLFPQNAVIGMVHLQPLLGSPMFGGDLMAVEAAARVDARALIEGGVDAIIVENFGDMPFHKGRNPCETIATMTRMVLAVKDEASANPNNLPVGINVLRNDAISALGIAAATHSAFIRVNVLTGTMLTDQGVIEGNAANLLRKRRELGFDKGREKIHILADVMVKHATPASVKMTLARAITDTISRGMADAIIVSGSSTGQPADLADLEKAAELVDGRVPLLVGSGVDFENASQMLSVADGLIVGTSLKEGGVVGNQVKAERVMMLVENCRLQ